MTTQEIEQRLTDAGYPRYRGRQVSEWLYKRSVRSLRELSNLPEKLRTHLEESFRHPLTTAVQSSESADNTIKFLVQLHDGNRIECVFLPYEDRISLCVSTQVGCAMNCTFCATAIGGLVRDLSAGEIVDQVLMAQASTGRRVTNVVYMGMGEPLANYHETVKSIRLLNQEAGISARRITVSTVGIVPAIRQLAGEGLPITLAVSLHAPTDSLRGSLIPTAFWYPLGDLLEACQFWIEKTNRRVTFEYLLLKGVNDSPNHAHQLAAQISSLLANVNIIPYNHVEGRGQFSRPPREDIDRFKAELELAGVTVTERMRRGNPVDGACGQLRNESEKGRKIASVIKPEGRPV